MGNFADDANSSGARAIPQSDDPSSRNVNSQDAPRAGVPGNTAQGSRPRSPLRAPQAGSQPQSAAYPNTPANVQSGKPASAAGLSSSAQAGANAMGNPNNTGVGSQLTPAKPIARLRNRA